MKNHKLIASLLGLLAGFILFVAILQLNNYARVANGATIVGKDFSGFDYQTTRQQIENIINNTLKQPIEISYGQYRWRPLPQDLGIVFNTDKTVQNVWSVGRDKNIFLNLKEQIESLIASKKINLEYSQNQAKLDEFFKKNLAVMETPAKNSTLKYDQSTDDFLLIPAQAGEVFDKEDFKNQLAKRMTLLDKKNIVLKRIIDKPVVYEDLNGQAESKAKMILAAAPYQLTYKSSSWQIEKQVLSDWLDFVAVQGQATQIMDVDISETQVKDFLSELAPSVNSEPVNAELSIQEGKVVAFALSQNGVALKIDESAQKIRQDILNGKKEIKLVAEENEPKISTKTIDTLGLTSLLGVGTSTFAGSPKNRIYNIGIGAGKINGLVVDPGQEFSIVQALGAIDASTGYLPELVIKDNKTIPEYGGGLCQVSTTLFRAAMYAGLKITERYPHAFPVHYYNPQGFDATIYPPHPDLRFLNDTPNHILIQSKIKGSLITFEIYGTDDGRQTKVVGPTILSSNSDGSMKTILYQEIWRDGALERKDTFRSSYKSPALYPVAKNPLE